MQAVAIAMPMLPNSSGRVLALLVVAAAATALPPSTAPTPGNSTTTTPAPGSTTTTPAPGSASTAATTFTAEVVGFTPTTFTANVSAAFRSAVAMALNDHIGDAGGQRRRRRRLAGGFDLATSDVLVRDLKSDSAGVRFGVEVTTPGPILNTEVIAAARAATFADEALKAFRAYLLVKGCAYKNVTDPTTNATTPAAEACDVPPNLGVAISDVHGRPGPPGPSPIALGLGLGLGLGIPLASLLAFALVTCDCTVDGM